MGTNYYIKSKDTDDIVKKVKAVPFVTEGTVDQIVSDLKIHVAKCSGGWKPLFEAGEHFSSFREL